MMTITLVPKTEAMLKARREGRDLDAVANDLLDDVLSAEAEEYAETVAAIQAGIDDVAAGRTRPLREVIVEYRQKRGLPKSWPSSEPVTEVARGVFVGVEGAKGLGQ